MRNITYALRRDNLIQGLNTGFFLKKAMIMSGHNLNWEKMNKRLSHPLLINAIKTYITTYKIC